MNQCFVCDTFIGGLKSAFDLFANSVLQSGKTVCEIISEILDKPVVADTVHSKVICKKCQKACIEYDSIKIRLQSIKSDLVLDFKNTLQKRGILDTTVTKEEKKSAKKIVLPASKLHPLPANYVFDVGKLPTSTPKNVLSTVTQIKPISSTLGTLNLKVTVGSSVLTHTIKTTSNTKINQTPTKNQMPSISLHKKPMYTFMIDDLPKDFLSSAILTKVLDKDHDKEDNEEEAMEIDEDCSLSVVPVSASNSDSEIQYIQAKDPLSKDKLEDYLDVELVPMSDGGDDAAAHDKYVLGKLEIMNEPEDEDEEEDTIVMEGENGSIIRVLSGQKLVCGDQEISLVMPDSNADSHDSNDESQIELQVSGDEETANAIIAAAQEKGGAFIKVESGEMFRVKSVQSTTDIDTESDKGGQTNEFQMVKQEGNEFKCLLCKDPCTSFVGDAAATSRHVRAAHDARVYVCGVCGRAIRRRAEYTAHVEEHANSCKKMLADKMKMHECHICKKKYSSRTVLSEHMNVHSGARPYACALCNKTFASKYTHQAHLKIHQDRPRPFKCSQCDKSFLTLNNLTQHEKTHSGVKDFICNICGKAFGTQHNLEMHGVVHSASKPFVCGVCGKPFARRAEVRDHMRTHTGERPFTCVTCGASFTQRSNLHTHNRATHLDDKRYHCAQCPKKFKRRRLLDYHVKATHTGERPLKCEVCKATFVYPEHYKKHLRIHNGEKPYVCEVCGKSFNSRDNRNTHRFVHSDKKPYECLVCGAGYMRKRLLYTHMNTSGHLAESIVVNQPRVQKAEDLFEVTEELELENGETKSIVTSCEEGTKLFITEDKKIILQDGKGTINFVQDVEDPLLSLHNIETSQKSDSNLLSGVTVEEFNDPTQIVTSEDNNSMVRLVQVQLPNGNNGWVAIN